jgi:hypothetical protein
MGLDVTGYCADNTYIDTQYEPENEMSQAQVTARFQKIAERVLRQVGSVHGYLTQSEAAEYQAAKDACSAIGIKGAFVCGEWMSVE